MGFGGVGRGMGGRGADRGARPCKSLSFLRSLLSGIAYLGIMIWYLYSIHEVVVVVRAYLSNLSPVSRYNIVDFTMVTNNLFIVLNIFDPTCLK